MAEPFVKWAGGKRRVLDDLRARMPPTYRRYFEPFVGGGALFFRLEPQSAVLSDTNHDLVDCYREIQTNVERVILAVNGLAKRHSIDHYYNMRERWNCDRTALEPAERAALFIYLNKTCYNGLWRVNRRGEFNVPAGRHAASPHFPGDVELRNASRALGRAQICHRGFEAVLDEAGDGDFVYFDPPYVPASPTANFTSYTKESFGLVDHLKLAVAFRTLTERGCAVMLSNSDTSLVHHLYEGLSIDRLQVTRSISCRGERRAHATGEVIVTNHLCSSIRPRRARQQKECASGSV